MASNNYKTYACHILNIPFIENLSEEDIKDDFKAYIIENIGHVSSIFPKFESKYQRYQCFVNFIDQNSAEKCAKIMNGLEYKGNKLEANSIDKNQPIQNDSLTSGTFSNSNRNLEKEPVLFKKNSIFDKETELKKTNLKKGSSYSNFNINNWNFKLTSHEGKANCLLSKDELKSNQNSRFKSSENIFHLNTDKNINKKQDKVFFISESDSSDNESINSENLRTSEKGTFTIKNGIYFKKFINDCFIELKRKHKNIDLLEFIDEPKTNLKIKIKTSNDYIYNECKKIIDNLSVLRRYYNRFSQGEFDVIFKKKEELIKTVGKSPEIYLKFNLARKQIDIYGFNNSYLNQVFTKIDKFCMKEIKVCKTIEIKNDINYNFLKFMMSSKERQQQLKTCIGLDERANIQLIHPPKNSPIFPAIRIEGTKQFVVNLNLNQIGDIFIKEYKIDNKPETNFFIKNRFMMFKRELEDKYIVLKFDYNSFHLIGFCIRDIEQNAKEINEFIKSVNYRSISVSNNYANINEIVAKIKKEFTDENNDSEIQINYVENKKKIIISGTDIDEINGVAKMLEENLKGQESSNQMIQCDQLVYEKLIKDDLFFKNFEKVKVFNKFNNNRTIRIIGEKQKVDDAKMQIELKCNELDKEIETLPFELSNSEFIYISTQALNEVKQIEKNTNSIIVESPYVKYASFTYNKTNVILCHGDILKLNVDAYVNPVNERMQANSGLAKLMIDKAGDKVNEKCKIYIQKNWKLSEGNVFVTNSGKLGCKKNSLIIHASGPVWRGGYSNEASKLASLVRLSFKEAIYNKCKSIAIPPVSCGIFGYEPRQATEIITENIIEFLKENNDNSLETVLLISNELEKVRIWAKSLFLVCTRSCLEIQISSSLLKHESRWYWLDDENNWKAYLEKYSDFIQENFERKKLTFDMNIDGKSYFIDLSKSDGYKQVNKKTNHVHQVTNVMPNETFYQWYWLDDKKNKSPYSLEHSKLIEQGYKKKKSFSMIIKKHVNDIDCEYIIDFSNNIFLDGSKADAVQINKETFFKRRMFREELLKNIEPNIEENVLKNKQLGHIIFITTFSENKHKVVQALRKIINNAKKREVLPVIDELTMEEMNRIIDENDVKIHIESGKLIVNGMKDNVDKVKNEFLTMIVNKSNKSKINLPDTWAEMEHSENLKLIEIQKSSSEFRNIYKEISKSVTDFEIVKIERIQSKSLWQRYKKQVEISLLANKVEENEKFLFHGTNETSPYTIYDDLVGFDMRFSREGLWGRGIYFAVNASYSKQGYSYKNQSEETHSIFYARVALGDYTEQPSHPWCLPPLKPNSKLRYDSIKGHTNGSDIFILYENGRAYPEYLITFSK